MMKGSWYVTREKTLCACHAVSVSSGGASMPGTSRWSIPEAMRSTSGLLGSSGIDEGKLLEDKKKAVFCLSARNIKGEAAIRVYKITTK